MAVRTITNDFYVYVLFRPDGRPCYVGKGRGNRWKAHNSKCRNPHLAAILANAGGELPAVKIRHGLSEAEAFAVERAFIAAIGREANGGPLVNATDGGDGAGGRKMSDEERAMRRAIMNSPEVRAKLGRGGLGKPSHRRGATHSMEARAKMSASRRGKRQSAETVAKRVAKTRGMKRSPESVRRRAMLCTGQKRTPEQIERMRIAALAWRAAARAANEVQPNGG